MQLNFHITKDQLHFDGAMGGTILQEGRRGTLSLGKPTPRWACPGRVAAWKPPGKSRHPILCHRAIHTPNKHHRFGVREKDE